MTTVASHEAQTNLPSLLEMVARGEKILITENDRPVAMLVPPTLRNRGVIQQAAEEMLAFRAKQNRTLAGLPVREMIEDGRRY